MDKNADYEKFLGDWNQLFPDNNLTVADFRKPNSMMRSLLYIFNRLGINQDAVLSPPPEHERDEHTFYYLDLIPVINVTRVMNYLLNISKTDLHINIRYIMQPSPSTSSSLLCLQFNYVLFNDQRLKDIEPYDAEFFRKRDQVKALEDKKNELLESLNQQAKEKGEREEKMKEMEEEIQQYEEEYKQEKQLHDEEKLELETLQKELQEIELVLAQKKDHRNSEQAELSRNKALRVYDSEVIKAQLAKATQNVQEADKKLNLSQETLKNKENILKNLQAIQPCLVTCNNYLNELKSLVEDNGEDVDIEADLNEAQLEMMNSEVEELEQLLAELQETRTRLQEQQANSETNMRLEKAQLMSTLRETEELERASYERSQTSLKEIQELKVMTPKYVEMTNQYHQEMKQLTQQFSDELASFEQAAIQKLIESKRQFEDKLRTLE